MNAAASLQRAVCTVLLAGLIGLGPSAAFGEEAAVAQISYTQPPQRTIWIEGEDAAGTNFLPGEARHNWWFGYAGVSGRGLLELANWRLPESEVYWARYDFEVPEDGRYVLYFRGRRPAFLSSPITWQIDDGPETRYPAPAGEHPGFARELATSLNHKMALVRLGVFEVDAGAHTLTIRVRELTGDTFMPYVACGIDSLLIHPAEITPREDVLRIFEPVEQDNAAPATAGGPSETAAVFDVEVDPQRGGHVGPSLAVSETDWSTYEKLRLWVRVEISEPCRFDSFLRLWYAGPNFIEVPVKIPADKLGEWVCLEYDLDEAFGEHPRTNVHGRWLRIFEKWYTGARTIKIELGPVELVEPSDFGREGLLEMPPAAPCPGEDAPQARQPHQWVWNVVEEEVDDEQRPGLADDPAAEAVEISAGRLACAFSPVNGGLREVRFADETGETVLLNATAAPPAVFADYIEIGLRAPRGEGRWSRDGEDWLWRQEGGEIDVELRVSPHAERDELRLTASVTNRADTPVYGVEIGPLGGLAVGEAADDTWMVGSKEIAFEDLKARHRLISPQALSHDWVCIYDGETTLSMRIEDEGCLDSVAVFGREGAAGWLSLRKSPRILPGETWQMPPLVIGADGTGSWHASADRFSDWWHSWAKTPYVPEWIRSAGGVAVAYRVLDENAIENNRETLQELREVEGVFWGHTSNWLPYRTEGWYPYGYRLSMEQLQQFRRVTDDLRARGGRMSIYSNPLMFSRVVPEYEVYGRDLLAMNHDGLPHYSEHTHRHHPMGLPQPSAEYGHRYADAVAQAVLLGRPDILYMDQLGAVPTHLDFQPDRHGHEHYGQWIAGQVEFVRVVHERFRPEYPELGTMIECPCPAVQQYVTLGLLMYNSHDVFRYTFPRYLNCVGGYGPVKGPEHALEILHTALLTGQPALLFVHGVKQLEEPVRRHIREVIELKQAHDEKLFEARFRDTLGLELSEGTEARIFVAEDGRTAHLPFLTAEDASGQIVVHPGPLGLKALSRATIHLAGEEGTIERPVASDRSANGSMRVELPAAKAGILTLTADE